ncbi:HNH endonuclease [Chelatococcus sp. YT9]|nr:HNH endonuclease [Chelatococcus sp. YT9]
MTELWAPVVGLEGFYEVSDQGRVRGVTRTLTDGRVWRGAVLAQSTSKSGHKRVRLCRNGRHLYFSVHRLVIEAFVGPCPPSMECAHNNGDPSDNRVSNLRWDTRKGNHADKSRHGTLLVGEKNALAKLTESDIRRAFSMRRAGALLKDIALELDITSANVSMILRRATWRHVHV